MFVHDNISVQDMSVSHPLEMKSEMSLCTLMSYQVYCSG